MLRRTLLALPFAIGYSLAPLALPATSTPPEKIVAGLSNDKIGITAAFNGSEVLLYGAVKRDTPEPGGPPLAIVVTLEGPPQSLTIRKKSREWGVWVNSSKVRVAAVPSYYSVASSGALAQILSPETDTTQRITVPKAVRAFGGPLEVTDARPYTEAMVRLREEDGSYSTREDAVHLVEDTLFRADFTLPANLVEGDYRTRIFLLRGGAMVDSFQTAISVRRVGLERWLFILSREHAPVYAVLSLGLAVFAGWAAAAAFRIVRN